MPIEIKELVIQASLARKEDRGEKSTKILSEDDMEMITNKVLEKAKGDPRLFPPSVKEAIIKEALERVQILLDEKLLR